MVQTKEGEDEEPQSSLEMMMNLKVMIYIDLTLHSLGNLRCIQL